MTAYGFLIGIGIIIAVEILLRKTHLFTYIDLIIISVLALIGARILFLLHNIEEIQNGLINIFAIWDGGLAFYGALLGIFISLFTIFLSRKRNFFEYTDKFLVVLPLMQSIGRIGNYFNNELYGKPSTLPWAIYVPEENRLSGYEIYTHFHPVFIYESILNLILFIFLFVFTKKKRNRGLVTGIYLIIYSLIRICMNMIRIDKEYVFGIETSDLLSYIFLLIGIYILLLSKNKQTKIPN
jgi:phosphatidylglycerol:prolipoprotein diacylglycerol transferase